MAESDTLKGRGILVAPWLEVDYHRFSRPDRFLFSGRVTIAVLLFVFSAFPVLAQTQLTDNSTSTSNSQQDQEPGSAGVPPSSESEPPKANQPSAGISPTSVNTTQSGANSEGRQPKRILWIIPNYRSVSADTPLPPVSSKDKFWLATQDSFDYSSFVLAGILAAEGQSTNSTPQFHQGAAGYRRYYWHSFADQAVGNYLTEAIVPIVTHEDPRYYTLGHGGFFRRTGYAVSRLLITRTDSGGRTFNFSEIVGNGAGAGISDLYYPAQDRTWTKTGQKWLTQVAVDSVFNVLKEFWPDINRTVFRGRY